MKLMRGIEMKPSNRIMLIALAVVAVMLFASVIAGRIVLERVMTPLEAFKEISDEDRKEVHKSWELDSFHSLEMMGNWDIEIREGASGVDLYAPSWLYPFIEVEEKSGVLRVGVVRTAPGEKAALRAVIRMPELRELKSFGALNGTIGGFSESPLRLELNGGTALRILSGSSSDFRLKANGGTMLDAQGFVVENARIEVNGAGEVSLSMNGGDLSGSLNGAVSLSYRGEVANERVSTSGVSSVKRR
jgi:hypothetical protein